MLAVQETNFLYSFTQSAFSALATFLSSHEKSTASTVLIVLSGIYSIFGFVVAVWMYGRKTSHDPSALNRRTDPFNPSVLDGPTEPNNPVLLFVE